MKPTELRIGNYTQIGRKIVKVSFWTRLDALWFFIFGIKDFNYMKPIPLTEEWLLKFGFKKYKNPNNTNSYIFQKDNFILYRKFSGRLLKYRYSDIKIKYVHQLQNLYFALTGKELTIKQ